MDDVTVEQGKLAVILEQRGFTETAEKFDNEILQLQGDLAALGVIPKNTDATADRLARLLSPLFKTTDSDVSEWRPSWFAFFVELMAVFGPVVMWTWIAGRTPELKIEPGPSKRKTSLAKIVTPALQMTPLAATPVSPATAKKPRKNSNAAVAGVESVRDWYASQVFTRPQGKLQVQKEVYEPYCGWCNDKGITPVKLRTFGETMKGELGVAYVEERKRGYYLGIALKGALKVVSG